MSVRRLFSKGGQNFQGGPGEHENICLKSIEKVTLFLKQKSPNSLFWVNQCGARVLSCPPRGHLCQCRDYIYFVKNPESFPHPLFVLGVCQDLRHGNEELGEVDLSVAVPVPHPDPLPDLVVRNIFAEACQNLLELVKRDESVLVAVEVSKCFLYGRDLIIIIK